METNDSTVSDTCIQTVRTASIEELVLHFSVWNFRAHRPPILAWEYGDWMDKPLSILAGLIIGVTAMVTLLRVWTVPPQRTVESRARTQTIEPPTLPPDAS